MASSCSGGSPGWRRRWWPLALLAVTLVLGARLLLLRRPAPSTALSRRQAVIRQRLQGEPIRNNQTFAVLHRPTSGCADDTKLLILVASTFDNWERRQAIRDTWGGVQHLQDLAARLVFLLGRTDDAPQDMIDAESAEYGDVLQETFYDSYGNLTLKSIMGLRWASQHCDKVEYVVKTDDDIYWNLPLLQSHLEKIEEERIITGQSTRCTDIDPDGLNIYVHSYIHKGDVRVNDNCTTCIYFSV